MDGWVFKRAFFEKSYPYNDKGQNSTPVPYYLELIIKYD